jgi:tetratricopeptide (TPR) repeat protein
MRVAASLGPDNRFVVRSAARLFLHEHDAGKALRTIRRAAGIKRDPWLLAAEIAVSSAAKSPALMARAGQARNDDENLSPFERTELASALATLEMENGKTRQARQLFRRALVSPTENSVAQVEWANRQIGGLEVVGTDLLRVPRSFEVNAYLGLVNGHWESAIAQGLNWLRDQAFSKRPAIFTSYVSSLVENYARSIEILEASLKVNPRDPMLINNLAFALASDGRINEAVEVLRNADDTKVPGTSAAITLTATHGLVFFRSGFPDRGRELYQLAIEKATKLGDQKYSLLADLYLAREELLAGTPVSRTAAKRALFGASKSIEKDVVVVATQVQRLLERAASGNPSQSPSAR